MYTIYVDGNLLYAPNLSEEGYAVENGIVSNEINKVGSLTFTMPTVNPRYNDVDILTSVITVFDNDEEVFRGRPVEISRSFQNKKTVRCEGWLSVLLDSVVRPYDGSGSPKAMFTKYIVDHNNMVDEAKRLRVGNVTVTDPNNYIARASSDYPRTFDEINDKLIDLLGGYIRFRRDDGKNYVDYIADYNRISNQIIEFGSNLLSFDEYISTDDLFTAIIPLGARDDETGERLNIKSVNNDIDYLIDSEAASRFGTIWHTEYWDDVTIASNLKSKAQKLLEKSVSAAVSLEMRAFDLHLLNVETDSFKVGDLVRVISLPHGIDDYFMCSKIEQNLLRPEQSTFTFGLTYKTFTGQTRSEIRAVTNAVESVIVVPPTTVIAYRSSNGAYWGDVNSDMTINSTDIDLIRRYMNGEQVTINESAVDLHGDGTITQAEADEMIELIENLPSNSIIVKVTSTTASGVVTEYWQYLDRSEDEG